MDLASIAGFGMGAVMVILGIITGDAGVAALGNFIDPTSIIITIGGSLAGVIMSNKIPDVINGAKSATLALKEQNNDPSEVIKNIIDLSNTARKEGLLALEEAANGIEDAFLKKGIMLVVDGTDSDLVRGILETDLVCVEARHKKVMGFWEKWGEMGPAWGMIGTLIGLVNMLQALDDVSTIGPNMAVALLTTLYGSLIANWICSPMASKLKVNNDAEISMKEVTIEGLLSIQAGENPRVIEEKLKSFLSPEARNAIGEAGGEE
ncbi:MAG: motility protein A [Eubacterium sp.]|nr:motility protein A [Eubacterium sp.]